MALVMLLERHDKNIQTVGFQKLFVPLCVMEADVFVVSKLQHLDFGYCFYNRIYFYFC